MVKLELPHVNLLTKMDLAEDKAVIDEYRIPDKQMLLDRLGQERLQWLRAFPVCCGTALYMHRRVLDT